MPSAGIDGALVERFRRDLGDLLASAGLALEAKIGVALSGGPDSLALLVLAAAAGPTMAMTVDHGLREDSAAEADTAGRVARSLGVPHAVIRVSVAPGGEGMQGEARRARYAALGEWATAQGLAGVLTAHHADDQAETLLMRLSRGSGLAGLTGIRPSRPLCPREGGGPVSSAGLDSRLRGSTVMLLRPLLGWRKAELEEIVAASGIEPARDPSNTNPRFDRTAARSLLAQADWIDPRRLAASASHLADAEAALAAITLQRAADAISDDDGTVVLRWTGIRELDRRLLVHLLADRFAKRPDGPAVERAMVALQRGETVTIADIIGRPQGQRWHFRAAPPRRSA
jgi:tRNA(Ile)-lysidine synthase